MNVKQKFAQCATVEEIKKLYRKLALKHHPDRGGSTEYMKAINAAYHEALENANGQRSTNGKRTYTYKYDREIEQAIMDMIHTVIAAGLPNYVKLLLIGRWLWITGTRRGDGTRDTLKECATDIPWRWHRKRQAWYWKPYAGGSYRSRQSLAGLAEKYGAREFSAEQRKRERKQQLTA